MKPISLLLLFLAALFAMWSFWPILPEGTHHPNQEEKGFGANLGPPKDLGGLTDLHNPEGSIARETASVQAGNLVDEKEELTCSVRAVREKNGPGLAGLVIHWLDTTGFQYSDTSELADLVLANGQTTQANAEGIVFIPMPGPGQRISLACHDLDLFGFRYQVAAIPDEIQELTVCKYVSISVSVRYSNGSPATNFPVSFASHDEHYDNILATEWTDNQGRALLHRFFWSLDEELQSHGVYLGMPNHAATSVVLPAGIPFPDPIELTVPDHGFVRIQAFQSDGSLFPDGTGVRILATPPPSEAMEGNQPFSFGEKPRTLSHNPKMGFARGKIHEGYARFPVALNQDLEFGVEYSEHREQLLGGGKGPTFPGQEVALEIHEEVSRSFLVGRFLDESGKPRGRTSVFLYMETSGGSNGETILTDESGEFRFPVQKARLPQAPQDSQRIPYRRLRYSVNDGLGRGHYGLLELSLDLDPGDTRIPDIRLDAPLLFGGTTVDEGGTPIPGVSLICSVKETNGHSRHVRRAHLASLITDQEGNFQLFGKRPEPLLQVKAMKSDRAPKDFDLENGVDGQFLNLSTGNRAFLRVLLPEGMPEDSISVKYHSTSPEGHTTSRTRNLRQRDGTMPIDLTEGTYKVSLSLQSTGAIVFEAPDVVIGSGAPQDPRLDPIDLRDSISKHVFMVYDPKGNLLPSFQAKAEAMEGDLFWSSIRTHRSGATLFLNKQTASVFILAEGYSGVKVPVTEGVQEVHLLPEATLQLRVFGLPELEENNSYLLLIGHSGTGNSEQVSLKNGEITEMKIPLRGTWSVSLLLRRDPYPEGESPFTTVLLNGQEFIQLEVPTEGELPIQEFEAEVPE